MFWNMINFGGVMMKLQHFDDRLIILRSARNGYLKGDIRSERDVQEQVTGLS